MDINNLTKTIQKYVGSEAFVLRALSGGYNNAVFEVTSNEDISLIAKVFDSFMAADREKKALKFAQEGLDVLAPSVYLAEDNVLLIERIEGTPAEYGLHKVTDKSSFFYSYGKTKALLHSVTFDKYGLFDDCIKPVKTNSEYVKQLFNLSLAALQKLEFNQTFLSSQKEFFNKVVTILNSDIGPCLCQHDSGLNNFLVDKTDLTNIVGVVDFEFADSASAIMDLCYSPRQYDLFKEYLDSILQGYSSISPVPESAASLFEISSWLQSLHWLTNIPDMSWPELSSSESKQRKLDLQKMLIDRCNQIIEAFPTI